MISIIVYDCSIFLDKSTFCDTTLFDVVQDDIAIQNKNKSVIVALFMTLIFWFDMQIIHFSS